MKGRGKDGGKCKMVRIGIGRGKVRGREIHVRAQVEGKGWGRKVVRRRDTWRCEGRMQVGKWVCEGKGYIGGNNGSVRDKRQGNEQ